MGYTVWYFVVDEPTGALKRIHATKWWRFWHGEALAPEWAGRELRVIELVMEVDRRRVQRVLRVLAQRMTVNEDGRPDVDREQRRTMGAVSALNNYVDPIRQLELDANRLWIPTETHLRTLAASTGCSVESIKKTVMPQIPEGA